jgi:hypothetical protein
MTRKLLLFLPGSLLLALLHAEAADMSHSSAPVAAQVTGAVKETELTTVHLSPQAEQRLGIKTVPAARRVVTRTRQFAGEVVVSLAGTNGNPAAAPVLGGSLDEMLRMADLQADADGRVAQARVQVEAARLALERAQKVLDAEAGSVRAVDEARAQLSLAEAALQTAEERRALLGEAIGAADASAPLWVRVSVYAGQLQDVDRTAPAFVRSLSSEPTSPAVPARVVAGPRTASPMAATVDLYYALGENPTGLRAGERVSVALSVRGDEEREVVPWAAVLHDVYGGQWVYEQTAPQTFVRRRVQVERVAGADAVVVSGPSAGAKIVTDGAAELFGTEFGAGH